MRNGAELIVVPNACTRDDIRTAGLKTRAFENLVGIAMANDPGANSGNSRAYTCVAWEKGKAQETTIARAGEQEQILLVGLDVGGIREFRSAESWRVDYQRYGKRKHTA